MEASQQLVRLEKKLGEEEMILKIEGFIGESERDGRKSYNDVGIKAVLIWRNTCHIRLSYPERLLLERFDCKNEI